MLTKGKPRKRLYLDERIKFDERGDTSHHLIYAAINGRNVVPLTEEQRAYMRGNPLVTMSYSPQATLDGLLVHHYNTARPRLTGSQSAVEMGSSGN